MAPIESSPLIYLHAHQNDLSLAKELENLLSPLQSQGLVRLYGAHHLPAGSNTRVELARHIDEARLVLPLVSADLLASEPASELIQRALARQSTGQTTVVPVLLRTCLWQFSPLRELKPLPSDGRAVTAWPTRQAAWEDVLQAILTVLGLAPQNATEGRTKGKGGDVVLRAGDGGPGGPGGSLVIRAGDGGLGSPGGNLTIKAGNGASGLSEREAGTVPTANPAALLLVAVSTESRALLAELHEQRIEPAEEKLGTRYVDTFLLPGRGRNWRVVVGQSVEKGPHAAHAMVQDLVREVRPEVVLLLGMCGGLPERDARENTVIVARQVLDYEPARLRWGSVTLAPTAYRAAAVITDLVNRLIARRVFTDIHIVAGKDYASGEKLVDDLDAPLRRQLLGLSGDLIGFEMEGHGMLHALWELQRDGRAIHAAMIKGVSDFGDGQMRDSKDARQAAATRRAVRVALEVLRRY